MKITLIRNEIVKVIDTYEMEITDELVNSVKRYIEKNSGLYYVTEEQINLIDANLLAYCFDDFCRAKISDEQMEFIKMKGRSVERLISEFLHFKVRVAVDPTREDGEILLVDSFVHYHK